MNPHDLLDQTITEPMPPFRDLDEFIAGQRRARRGRRISVVAGAAATVLAVVAGVVFGVGTSHHAAPPVGSPPTGFLSLAEMDQMIKQAVQRHGDHVQWLPDQAYPPWTTTVPGWWSTWVVTPGDPSAYVPYNAVGLLQSGDFSGMIRVSMGHVTEVAEPQCTKTPEEYFCRTSVGPNGERILVAAIIYAVTSHPVGYENVVEVYRADGTYIGLTSRNQFGEVEGVEPIGVAGPLSLDQMRAIALDPEVIILPPSPDPRDCYPRCHG